MEMKLEGVIALVTGGASGIGRATVSALAKAGAKNVYILDIDCDLGKSVAEEINAELSDKRHIVTFHHCDVTREESIINIFKHVAENGEQVAILVNCAGIIDESKWQMEIDINLKGLASATLTAIEHMGKHNGGVGGVIINISSISGILLRPTAPVYCAVKHAVVSLSRSLADESLFAHHGVRINCVCPTLTDTPMAEKIGERLYKKEWNLKFRAFGRVLLPGEVVSVIMSLITNDDQNGDVMIIRADHEPINVDFSSVDSYVKPPEKI